MGRRERRRSTLPKAERLAPLMEIPSSEMQCAKDETSSSWDLVRTWVRIAGEGNGVHPAMNLEGKKKNKKRSRDLKLLLGVLGCPLAPIPLSKELTHPLPIKDSPIEASSARYIVHQYLAATGFAKRQKNIKTLYATGSVKMVCFEKDSHFRRRRARPAAGGGGSRGGSETGCFVLWQMSPEVWLVELVVAGCKVAAGSDGSVVWRHVPWLGTHAARGPARPLRRTIQGLDPRSTASMFTEAQCLGEKKIGDDDCFVLRVTTNTSSCPTNRTESFAEVIRHVLYGYFSQRSGLLVFMEDSVLTRVQSPGSPTVYWETTIGSGIEDYRDVDGVLIAHRGRSVSTIFRFGESPAQHNRTRLEEVWRIDDVVFNVHGLSMDCFIAPTEILNAAD